MTTQHKPQGEWFYDPEFPDDVHASASDVAEYAGDYSICEVVGAVQVWTGFGFSYPDENGCAASAWFATKAEADAALAEIKRKQGEAQ